jgi:hypothetical protein
VLLALALLGQAVVRSVLTKVDQLVAVFRGQQIAAPLAQGLTVGRPPVFVLLLDLTERIGRPDVGQRFFLQRDEARGIVDQALR